MKKIYKIRKIELGEIRVNFAEAGKGEKTIVMVHGWTNNWIGLSPIARRLAKKHRVLLVELPGYGDSDRLANYDLETEAKYLIKLINKLKLKKPFLLGHSMGTFVIAKCYEINPELAAGLVMVAPVVERREERWLGKFFAKVKKRKRIVGVIKRIIDTRTYSYLTAKYINMYKFNKQIIDKYGVIGKRKMDGQAYVDMGWSISGTRTEELIANNEIPMMLLFGKQDKITNRLAAEKVLGGRGNYEFREIDQAGHIVPVEKPKETARVIEEWIEKVSGRAV